MCYLSHNGQKLNLTSRYVRGAKHTSTNQNFNPSFLGASKGTQKVLLQQTGKQIIKSNCPSEEKEKLYITTVTLICNV